MILINFKEISFLSVLVVNSFAPFYQSVFEIITIHSPYSTSISIALLACNLILIMLSLGATWSILSSLKPVWSVGAIILKLFPYLIAVPLFTYSLGSAIHDSLLGRIVAIFNISIGFAYLLFH